MSRTKSQLTIDLETILECEHGAVIVREDFKEFAVRVIVSESTIAESMFDEEQFSHIIDSLTPNRTGHVLEVVGDDG